MECQKCRLANYRTNIVYGRGNIDSKIMLIGEAPGKYEDEQGEAFVGRAGQLLDELLSEIGITDRDVFITNAVQCRPPQNRNPLDDEIEACKDFLAEKIKEQKPKIIILLGKIACRVFFGDRIIKRGEMFERSGQKFIHIFHPAYLLRNEDKKKTVRNWLEKYKDFLLSIKDERSVFDAML